jgi:photosystem II stability/assembly factor-like uncharacterized protein
MCGVVTAQTWEEIGFNLPPGDSTSYSTNITFTSKNNGWLYIQHYKKADNTIYKKLYKTTDGGISWKTMRTEINNNYYNTVVYAIEPDFFYMVNKTPYPGYTSKAIYTTNGGTTWDSTTIANGATYDGFKVLHFFDKKQGIAVDDHCWITKDGGRSWSGKRGVIAPPQDVYFYNQKIGWAVGKYGDDAGYIAKTTDGGDSWVYQDKGLSSKFIVNFGVEFLDSLKGFAAGTTVKKTTDGGAAWQGIVGVDGVDVQFLDKKNGWISSWGQIYRTSDGGETWANQIKSDKGYQFIKIILLEKDKIAYVLGVEPYSNTATLYMADLSKITGVEKKEEPIPAQFSLSQNYPNPFNPTTVISYQLSAASHVMLKVFDLLGREVAALVDEYKQAGAYNCEFRIENGELPSGVYYYRLTTGSFSETKKMAFLK